MDVFSSERNHTGAYSHAKGVLLGLSPLAVFLVSIVTIYLAGYCGNGLILLLQEIAVTLWALELLAGGICFFNARLRSFAIDLLLTLLFSVLLAWSLEQLSFWFTASGSSPLCHFRN
jgi:hypothetical protein